MDIKKATKNVKNRLKELGYDVKHTHCREVVAAALGLKNGHLLKNEKKKLFDDQDFLIKVSPNTTNEYYHEEFFKLIKLNLSEVEDKLTEAINLVKNKAFSISVPIENKFVKLIENINDEDGKYDEYYFIPLRDEDVEYYEEQYIKNYSFEIVASGIPGNTTSYDLGYIEFIIHLNTKEAQIIYTSYQLAIDEFLKEKKEAPILDTPVRFSFAIPIELGTEHSLTYCSKFRESLSKHLELNIKLEDIILDKDIEDPDYYEVFYDLNTENMNIPQGIVDIEDYLHSLQGNLTLDIDQYEVSWNWTEEDYG